jgi:hypothetical protein
MVGPRKPEIGCAMSTQMDDTLAAIGHELLIAYLPTVREPLPRELADLVVQLVAFERRERGSSVRPAAALQYAMARPAPDPRSTDPSINDSLIGGCRREPHHKIGLSGLEPPRCPISSRSGYLAQTETRDVRFLSARVALHARPWPEMA